MGKIKILSEEDVEDTQEPRIKANTKTGKMQILSEEPFDYKKKSGSETTVVPFANGTEDISPSSSKSESSANDYSFNPDDNIFDRTKESPVPLPEKKEGFQDYNGFGVRKKQRMDISEPDSDPKYSFNPLKNIAGRPKTVVQIGDIENVDLEKNIPIIVSDRKAYAEALKNKIKNNEQLTQVEFDQIKEATGYDDELTILALSKDENFGAVKTIKEVEKNKTEISDYLQTQDASMKAMGESNFPQGLYGNYNLDDENNVNNLFARLEKQRKDFISKTEGVNPLDGQQRNESASAKESLKEDSSFMQQYNKLKYLKAQQISDNLIKQGVIDSKQIGLEIQRATEEEKHSRFLKSKSIGLSTGDMLTEGIRNIFKKDTPLQDYELENTGSDYAIKSLQYEAAKKKIAGEDNSKEINSLLTIQKSKNNLYNKFPDVREGQIVAFISDAKAREEGLTKDTESSGVVSRFGYSTSSNDVIRIAKENGFYDTDLDRKLVNDIASQQNVNPLMQMFVPAYGIIKKIISPIENVSFAGQFAEGAKGVVTSTGKSIVDIAQLRGNSTISSEQYNDDVINQWKKDQSNLDETQKNIALIGNTTGQIVGQALSTLAFTGVGKAAALSEKAVENTAFWASGALVSYADGKKSLLDITNNSAKAEAGALLIAFFNAVSEKMFKDTKVFGDVFNKRLGNILQNIDEGQLYTEATRNAIMKGLKSDLAQWGKNFVVESNKEGFEEFSTAVLQDGTEAIFGDNKTFDITKTWENARDTYVSTLIGASLAAGKAAYTDIHMNPNAATSLYHASQKPNYYISSIQELVNKNQLTQDEANKKIQLINTATQVNNEITQLDNKLSDRQKAAYVSYRTTQSQLQELVDNTTDPTIKSKLEEKIKILDEQKGKILNGLQFNEKLEPLNTLYDKEQKYLAAKKANEEAPTIKNADVLEIAKTEYSNTVIDYYQQTKPNAAIYTINGKSVKKDEFLTAMNGPDVNDLEMVVQGDDEVSSLLEKKGGVTENILSNTKNKNNEKNNNGQANGNAQGNQSGQTNQTGNANENGQANKDEVKTKPTRANFQSPLPSENPAEGIVKAVIEVGGKMYEGKNHAEAILAAQKEFKQRGEDFPQVDRKAEGKFKLADGTIIDRAKAKEMFGADQSELLIPQDEAADKANKDYAELKRQNAKNLIEPLAGKGALMGMDADQSLKFIAEQAQGISQTGEDVSSTGTALQPMIEAYGKEIVDAAIEIHPKESLLKTDAGGVVDGVSSNSKGDVKEPKTYAEATDAYKATELGSSQDAKNKKQALVEQAETEEGKKFVESEVSKLEKNDDGTITVFRSGTLQDGHNPATTSKKMAETIASERKKQGLSSDIVEVKVNPSDISVVVKGIENEVFVKVDKNNKERIAQNTVQKQKTKSELIAERDEVQKDLEKTKKAFNDSETAFNEGTYPFSENVFKDANKKQKLKIKNLEWQLSKIDKELERVANEGSGVVVSSKLNPTDILKEKLARARAEAQQNNPTNEDNAPAATGAVQANGSQAKEQGNQKPILIPSKPTRQGAAEPASPVQLKPKVGDAVIAEINSKNLSHVEGTGMGAKEADGIYISTEDGNRYATKDNPAKNVTVNIANPKKTTYVENAQLQQGKLLALIKAKKISINDISEEYRQEVANHAGKKISEVVSSDVSKWHNDIQKGKINEDYFSQSARTKAAKLITEQYKSEGYDALYFPTTDTQEGQLIVFERSNIKINNNENNQKHPDKKPGSEDVGEKEQIIENKAQDAEFNKDPQQAAAVIDEINAEIEKDAALIKLTAEQQARDKGEKTVDGTVVKRQSKIASLLGKAVNILFSKEVSQEGNYAVIDVADMQPSHKSGIKNEKHFIPEAQPRDRGGMAVLKNEAKNKADNLDPNQLGDNNIAYFGSPIINELGEVIQGNGRAEAIDYYYNNNKTDSKGYKAMLMEKAALLGLDPAAISKIKNPVLVRVVKVSDERAIILGNKTASELEDVKQKGADVKAAMGNLSQDKIQELSKVINAKTDESSTLKSIIRDNAKTILDKLFSLGALRVDNREQYFGQDGVTPEGIQRAYDIVRQLLFTGGNADLQQKFDNLPFTQREGIEKVIPAILSNPVLKSRVQEAIDLMYAAQESGAKDFDTWQKSRDMFGDQLAPMEKYDPNTLKFANEIFAATRQKEISTKIAEIAQKMNGAPATLWDAAVPVQSFVQAIGGVVPPLNSIDNVVLSVSKGEINADDAAIKIDESGIEVTNDIYDKLRYAERQFAKLKTGLQVGDAVMVKGRNGVADFPANFRGVTKEGDLVVVAIGSHGETFVIKPDEIIPAEVKAPVVERKNIRKNSTTYEHKAIDSKGNELYISKDGLSATYPYYVQSASGSGNSIVDLISNTEFPEFAGYDLGEKQYIPNLQEKDVDKSEWTDLEKEVWDSVLSKKQGLALPNKKAVSDYKNLIAQNVVYVDSFGSGSTVSLRLTAKGEALVNPPTIVPNLEEKKGVKKVERKVRNEKDQKDIDAAIAKFRKGGGPLTMGGLDPERIEAGVELVGLYIKKGVYKFADMVEDFYAAVGETARDYFDALKSVYGTYRDGAATDEEAAQMDQALRGITFDNIIKPIQDVPNRPSDSQPNGENDNQPGNAGNVSGNGDRGGRNRGGSSGRGGRNYRNERGQGTGSLFAPAIGAQNNNGLHQQDQPAGIEDGNAGVIDGRGNRVDGPEGVQPNNGGNDNVDKGTKEEATSFGEQVKIKLAQQKAAESIPIKLLDRENVSDTLPFLLTEQQDDVLKAEKRFSEKGSVETGNGKGVMFTNGTGTGKTYVALGLIKRLEKQGKKNILVVVPSQQKVQDWSDDGKNLGLNIVPIESTVDGGQPMAVTTYANFRNNLELLKRDFDLVIYDESHRLMESKTGDASSTTGTHYLVSNKDARSAFERITSVNPLWIKAKELNSKIRQNMLSRNNLDLMEHRYLELVDEGDAMERDLLQITKQQNEATPELRERAETAAKNTKVVFLSATPFKTHFNLRYANGFLFNWGNETTMQGNSRVDPESRFFLDNFGSAYEWKYHRLQVKSDSIPDAVAMQEIQFSQKMMASGSISGRTINSERDYSREFPLVSGFNSQDFNRAFNGIFNYDTNEFSEMRESARDVFFNYNYTTQLFESLKASMSIDRIKKHLDLGRKVVIFHRRQQANVFPPFESILNKSKEAAEAALITAKMYAALKKDTAALAKAQEDYATALDQIEAFKLKYADLLKYEQTLNYSSAVDQIQEAFPNNAVFFNGQVPQKQKAAAIKSFNTDGSGKNILLVQEEAGKEGISLHDTTGSHQRVLMSLSMPISTITALQIEGRIYRIGQETDGIFEYPLLGLDLEIAYFGQNINKRLSTTENLAVGDAARDLTRSFAEGVLFNSTTDLPSTEQGKGGKEFDRKADNATTDFQKARLIYSTNQKVRGRRDQRVGVDYYATPEPVGQKMVEWAGLKPGEHALEPSAGHGAIAMWVPNSVALTAVEPSFELYSKLSGRAGGSTKKVLNQRFEDFNIVNKFGGIIMNPPFGTSGKTAMDHVEKAFKHLQDGGRLVALLPAGGSMQKRLDEFLYGMDEKGRLNNPDAHLRATINLPSVTFAQAGTSVNTQVVIIDRINKVTDNQADQLNSPRTRTVQAETINELFDAIEDIEVPARVAMAAAAATAPANIGENAPAANTPAAKILPITEHINTRTNAKQFVAKMGYFLGDEYKAVAQVAKRHNGGYSTYVKGFLFDNKENADNFVKEINAPSESKFSSKDDFADFETADKAPVTVGALSKKYPDAVVVKSQSELPAKILEDAKAQGVKVIEGVLHNGKVYLVADNLTNMGRAEGVYRHETIGHQGVISVLKGKLGTLIGQLMDNATEAQLRGLNKLSQRLYGKNVDQLDAQQKNILGQEYIAIAAEKPGSYTTTWEKIKSFVRSVLRDMGIKISVSDNDIKVLLNRANKLTLQNKNEKNEQPIKLTRLSEAEERGRDESGSINAKAAIVASGVHKTIAAKQGVSNPNAYTQTKNLESKALEKFATDNGLMIPLPEGKIEASGNESDIYLDPNNNTKLIKVNNANNNNTWLELLDGIAIHNSENPTTVYKIKGFTKNAEGEFSIVLTQNRIIGNPASLKEINTHLIKDGYQLYGDYGDGSYINKEKGIILEDVKEDNVLKDKEGNLHFIDTDYYANTKQKGGDRKLEYAITPPENKLSLQKLVSYANDIITGKTVFNRFSQDEQRGFAAGGQIHAEASIILAAEDSTSSTSNKSIEEQESTIEAYAKERGVWVENVNETFDKKYSGRVGSGEEAIVWDNGDTVVKSQNTLMYGNLQEKLDGITLMNTQFPEAAIEVIGFGRNEDGDFQVIIKQPFIEADPSKKITQEQLNNYLEKIGYTYDNENNHSHPANEGADNKIAKGQGLVTQHSIQITPELKAAVEEGMPLFSSKELDDRLKKLREQRDLQNEEPVALAKDLKAYADSIIKWVKGDNQDATASDVIAELEPEEGKEFTSAEKADLFKYVNQTMGSQPNAGQQQGDTSGQQQQSDQEDQSDAYIKNFTISLSEKAAPNESLKTDIAAGYSRDVLDQDDMVDSLELDVAMGELNDLVAAARGKFGEQVIDYAKGLYNYFKNLKDDISKLAVMVKLKNDLDNERKLLDDSIQELKRKDPTNAEISNLTAEREEIIKELRQVARYVDEQGAEASKKFNILRLTKKLRGVNVASKSNASVFGKDIKDDADDISGALDGPIENNDEDDAEEDGPEPNGPATPPVPPGPKTPSKGSVSKAKASLERIKNAKSKLANLSQEFNKILEEAKKLC